MVLQISKTHSSPHRNNMLLKDGTTSKNMLPRGLTSLLDSSKNKASSAAGPAGPAGPAAAVAAAAAPAACCGWYCWRWCCKPPKRTLRHTETPCYWRTERPPKTCCPGAWRPFWILEKKEIAAAGPAAAAGAGDCSWSWWLQLLGLLLLLPLLLLLLPLHAASGAAGGGAASFQNAPFATLKHHATKGRNDLQKHVPRGLTSLLDSGKNKASSAAGPAGPAAAAAPAACCGWYCWRWCCKPPKRTLRHTETPCYWRTERPPKTCCPGAWRPFWILEKKRLQLLGLLLLLVLLLEVVLQASKTHPSPHQNTMLLKDETTSKSIARTSSLEAGTSLLKSHLLSYPAIVLESSLILLSY